MHIDGQILVSDSVPSSFTRIVRKIFSPEGKTVFFLLYFARTRVVVKLGILAILPCKRRVPLRLGVERVARVVLVLLVLLPIVRPNSIFRVVLAVAVSRVVLALSRVVLAVSRAVLAVSRVVSRVVLVVIVLVAAVLPRPRRPPLVLGIVA